MSFVINFAIHFLFHLFLYRWMPLAMLTLAGGFLVVSEPISIVFSVFTIIFCAMTLFGWLVEHTFFPTCPWERPESLPEDEAS